MQITPPLWQKVKRKSLYAVESAALNIQYALNMQYAGSRQLLNGDYVNKNIDEYFDSHQYFVLMLEFCSFSSDVSIPYNL